MTSYYVDAIVTCTSCLVQEIQKWEGHIPSSQNSTTWPYPKPD